MAVAQKGEQADPRIPAPAELRPVLGFSRLSAAAYSVIARVIDEDGMFRARVAESADEVDLGRASWLWLHRPVGWAEDPALTGAGPGAAADPAPATSPTAAAAAKKDEKAAAARLRKAAADADAARRRTADQLAEVRRSEAAVRTEHEQLAASVAALQEERNAAVRRSKDIEAQLAAARRDLKVARQATTDAEVEIARLRAAGTRQAGPAAQAPVVVAQAADPAPTAPVASPDPFDRDAVAGSVRAAADAAAELASALADAAGAIALGSSRNPATDPLSPPPAEATGPVPKGKADKKRAKKSRKVEVRNPPALPPGVFDGTVAAHRYLIGDSSNLLVVDGYNVARAAWTGLAPEEERRRTVALLDDVQARSGGRVVVVFDGDDSVTAPKASKNVRVRFSATGQTADDAIVALLAATPITAPVVVVSSDREVAADARRQGAVAMGSREFLTAAGR